MTLFFFFKVMFRIWTMVSLFIFQIHCTNNFPFSHAKVMIFNKLFQWMGADNITSILPPL